MANRKLLTSDAINLKAKVKAEMQRRSRSGSVASYGGTAYDFTAKPTEGGPVLGEHLKKNLEPMRAVNPAGLPSYPGELTGPGLAAMEVKINAWRTRGITDRGASDCASGCTGTCFTSCTTGCYTGCSSCTGCSGSCKGSCTGCSNTCTGSCTNTCTNTCQGCGDKCSTGCNWDCTGGCSSCSGSCSGGCSSTCLGINFQ